MDCCVRCVLHLNDCVELRDMWSESWAPLSNHLGSVLSLALVSSVILGRFLSPFYVDFLICKTGIVDNSSTCSTCVIGMSPRLNEALMYHTYKDAGSAKAALPILTAALLSRNLRIPSYLIKKLSKLVSRLSQTRPPLLSRSLQFNMGEETAAQITAKHCLALHFKKFPTGNLLHFHHSDPIPYRRSGSKAYTQLLKLYFLTSRMPWTDFHVLPRKFPVMQGHELGCDLNVMWW